VVTYPHRMKAAHTFMEHSQNAVLSAERVGQDAQPVQVTVTSFIRRKRVAMNLEAKKVLPKPHFGVL